MVKMLLTDTVIDAANASLAVGTQDVEPPKLFESFLAFADYVRLLNIAVGVSAPSSLVGT